jgi:hypothetical protein
MASIGNSLLALFKTVSNIQSRRSRTKLISPIGQLALAAMRMGALL